tara:strand:+ start:120 stop:320 length:201 start_codon:yes stop_codon:yes gene_type:complete
MKIVVIKDTFANGEPLAASDKPIEVDDKVGVDLIAAQKAIPAKDAPAPAPAPKKKAKRAKASESGE